MDMNSISSNEVFFEDIFNEYSDDVYKLAFTYVKRKDIAEDLVQEVFVKVYKNLDKFQNNSSIKTWIFSIAINQCKDYLRSAYYRYIYLSEKISSVANGGTKTPEELVLEEFGKHLLTKDVLSLPIKYREVIILYYFQELKIKEITDVLKVNENTIKSRLTRAKEIMKKKYYERGNQDGERTNKASQGVSYK